MITGYSIRFEDLHASTIMVDEGEFHRQLDSFRWHPAFDETVEKTGDRFILSVKKKETPGVGLQAPLDHESEVRA